MQNADLTLSAGRGNAMDIASLTIALLRASKIPARYVHGTIDIPEAHFRNWAGGFTNIYAAMDFAASGGIPTTPVTSGGQVTKVRIEHIWVEAAIDYQPSRGAKNRDADSWVPMDPSYKQYEYLAGLDAVAISGLDPNQLATDFTNSGTVNEAEGWVTGFDPTILQNAQTQTQTALNDYITNNLTNPTVGDVIGGRKTIIKQYPVLPSSLPNKIVVTGSRYGALPSQLQHHMAFAFEKDILGDLVDPISYPYAQLNNQKVTLSFKPATADDEAALQSLLPAGEITDISQLPTSIPAYLINVIPEIKLNGQVVKQGSPMPLGTDLSFNFRITYQNYGSYPYEYKVPAGSYLSVAVVGGSVSPKVLTDLQSKVTQTKTTLETGDATLICALGREDLLGDLFYAGTLGYYAQYTALSKLMGQQQKAQHYLAAGYGTFGYEPNVDTVFGIPRAITTGGAAMNIPMINIIGTDSPANTAAEDKKNYALQIGILSSALEHAVPEQLFNTDPNNPPDAISAVKALSKASAAGQRIYHITQANQGTALPNIHHDPATIAEIQNALNVGKEVITHTDAVTVPGWTGAGYIIFDPETGDGAYKIGGGQNGAFIAFALFFAALALFALLPFFLAQFSLSLAIISIFTGVISGTGLFENVMNILGAGGDVDLQFSQIGTISLVALIGGFVAAITGSSVITMSTARLLSALSLFTTSITGYIAEVLG